MTSSLTQGEQSVAAKVKRTNTAVISLVRGGWGEKKKERGGKRKEEKKEEKKGGGGGERRREKKGEDFLKVGQRQSGRQSTRVSVPFLLMTYLLHWRNNVCIHTTHAIAVYIFTVCRPLPNNHE